MVLYMYTTYMGDQLIKLRCSALPIAFKCAGSVRRGPVVINETHEAAEMGTVAHAGAAPLVKTGGVDWDSVPELARRWGVDERELRVLLSLAAKLWAQVRDSFPSASTEVEMVAAVAGVELSGHADILGASADAIHVGDWKFGRKDADYAEQLLGYCALALIKNPSAERATAGVLWVREGEYEHYTLGRHMLATWEARLRTEVVEWAGEYRPGPHCAHCPRNIDCVASNALVRRDVAAIADNDLVARLEDEAALATMAPEQLVEVLAKADMVSKYAERVRVAIRSHVMRNGDIVASGKRLTLQHEVRRGLDPLAAFPVLEEHGFGDPEMAEVIDISLAKAEAIVGSKAGKGKGAGAIRALRAALEAGAAIKTTTISKLVVKRA